MTSPPLGRMRNLNAPGLPLLFSIQVELRDLRDEFLDHRILLAAAASELNEKPAPAKADAGVPS